MTTYSVYSYRELNDGEISMHLMLKNKSKEVAKEFHAKKVAGTHRKATWIMVADDEASMAKLNAWLAKREEVLAPKRNAWQARRKLANEQMAQGKRFSGDIVRYYKGEYSIITY